MNCCRKTFALWARNQFHLPRDVRVDTLSTIIKQESKITEYSNSGLLNKREEFSVRGQDFENATIEWAQGMFNKEINVSNSLAQAKAKQTLLKVKGNLPIGENISNKLCNSW